MVIAVIAVGVVQMAVDQKIEVIAMRNFLMPAVRTVYMLLVVAAAMMIGRAPRRILGSHRKHMLDDRAVGIEMVQMTVVQVIDVPFMVYRSVAAACAVLMIVMAVHFSVMRHNDFLSLKSENETNYFLDLEAFLPTGCRDAGSIA